MPIMSIFDFLIPKFKTLLNSSKAGLYFERAGLPLIRVHTLSVSILSGRAKEISNLVNLEKLISQNYIPKCTESKKIVIINRQHLFGISGGVNLLMKNLAFALALRGHKVIVLCESIWLKKNSLNIGGVQFVALKPAIMRLQHRTPPYYSSWSSKVDSFLNKYQHRLSNSVLITTNAGLELYGARNLPTSIKKICYLVTGHLIHKGMNAHDLSQVQSPRISLLAASEDNFLGREDFLFVGDSDSIIKETTKMYPKSKLLERANLIHIGWPKLFQESPIELIPEDFFLFIGSISHRKGVKTLLDAWEQFMQRLEGAQPTLIVCGESGDDHASVERITKLIGSKSVIRLRRISEMEKLFLLRRTKGVVVPSIYESFGIVGLEGLNYSSAVIASDAEGLREVLGEAALFFPKENSRKLADLLLDVYLNGSPIPVDQLRERAAQYSMVKMLEQLEHLIL